MYWSTGSGRIELNITKAQVAGVMAYRQQDKPIADLRKMPKIKRQLNKIDPALLAEELKEYGAWSEDELKDHDENLSRILWIACGDINEGEGYV